MSACNHPSLADAAALGGDVAKLCATPRLALGNWPSPVEMVSIPGGSQVLVKRDDVSGFGRGGAKTRKIEGLLGHMQARHYNQLITVAGNVTNIAFDLLPALAGCGLSHYLLIQNDPPVPHAERRKIFRQIETQIHFAGKSLLLSSARCLAVWLRGRLKGSKPFLLLPGGSHPAGVVGNALGVIEMALQLRRAAQPLPKLIFVTLATGTTVAGFLLAAHALAQAGFPKMRVVGVQVYPGRHRLRTLAALRWTERFYRLSSPVPAKALETVETELAGGFGAVNQSLTHLVAKVKEAANLDIDPIFGGKTWRAMERYLITHQPAAGEILYWHCGYTPEWQDLVRSPQSAPRR